MRIAYLFAIAAVLLACAAPVHSEKPAGVKMLLASTAFNEGEVIPAEFSGYGDNRSPDLNWSQVPEGARSFALVCRDPDAPVGTFIHWVIFNIPDTVRQLPRGVPPVAVTAFGAVQGRNQSGTPGYTGPRPPSGTHRYYFDLYALDAALGLDSTATWKTLDAAMQGHVLGQATLMGRYSR
jgi:Raf kinase inhibitor-like YbhB/YbcL family protein